jgi:DNA-binding response OmpR family regulator
MESQNRKMKRILVIEDEDALRSMLHMSLVKMGYAVDGARNGKEGIAAFNAKTPDLVLTDLIMPEKEGLEMIRELKKANPGIKIIAMTGGGRLDSRDNLKMAKLFGATLALPKPFAFQELAAAIAQLLGQGEAQNPIAVALK